jgi:hypothetical protein
MTYATIMLLLSVHFVADFVLQTDWMALNKSTRWWPLTVHILVYSACLIPFGLLFALVNGCAHFVTDAVSSRATSYLWGLKKRHLFFVVIGLDQLAHYAILFWTYQRLC